MVYGNLAFEGNKSHFARPDLPKIFSHLALNMSQGFLKISKGYLKGHCKSCVTIIEKGIADSV